MSAIDERIVQMKFDNHLFEKNVATSLSTLDKLKKALRFDGIDHNIQELNSAVSSINFSKLVGNVEDLNSKFSTMGIVGMTVIQDLTRSAEKLGATLYNSVIGQIKSGGWSRATNIDKAKFAIEGLGYAFKDLDGSISNAVNDTRFGYDEAATAASQLVASNVAIGEEMDNALMSISNVASQTNSSYSDIAHIYTTIAGNGKLMTEQLNQFSYRGMNAAAMLGKVLNKTEAEIREMTTKGQIDFKTFSDAMNKALDGGAKRANETFEGSLANMKAALSRIGQPFAETIRKYAVPVFNNLKEVIKTTKSYLDQLVEPFEDFMAKASNFTVSVLKNIDLSPLQTFIDMVKEAYNWFDKFMTSISPYWKKAEKEEEKVADAATHTEEQIEELAKKVMSGAYGNGVEARRKALEAEGHSFELIQNKVNELMGCSKRYEVAQEDLTKAVEENNEAEKTAQELQQEGLKSYTKALKEQQRKIKLHNAFDVLKEKIGPIVSGIQSLGHIASSTISAIVDGGFEPMVKILTNIGSIILDILGGIGRIFTAIDDYLTKTGAYDILEKAVNTILTDFSGAIGGLVDAINKFVSPGGGLEKFLSIFTDTPEDSERLAGSMGKAHDAIKSFFGTLKDFILSDGADGLQGIVDSLLKLVPILGQLQPLIDGIVANIIGVKGTQALSSLLDVVRLAPKYLNSLVRENNAEALLKLAEAVGIFALAMFALSNLSWEEIQRGGVAIGAIAGAITELWLAFNKFAQFKGNTDLGSIVGTFVSSVANDNNANAILKLAGAVGIMALAFAAVAQLDWDKIAHGAVVLADIVGTLTILWALVSDFSFGGSEDSETPIGEVAEAITGDTEKLSVAIDTGKKTIVDKIKGTLGDIKDNASSVIKGAGGTISGAITAVWEDVSEIIGNYMQSLANNNNATALLKLAGGLAIVAAAFFALAQLNWDQVAVGGVAIGIVTAAFLGISFAIEKIKKAGAIKPKGDNPLDGLTTMLLQFGEGVDKMLSKIGLSALIASLGVAILALGKVIVDISAIPFEKGLASVGLLGLVMLELVGTVALINKTGSGSLKNAAILLSIGTTIKALGEVLNDLSAMPLGAGIKALGLLGALLLEMWLALKAIANIGTDETNPIKIDALMLAIGTTVKKMGSTLAELSKVPLAAGLKAAGLLGLVLLELWLALKGIAGFEDNNGIKKTSTKVTLMISLGDTIEKLGNTLITLGALPFGQAIKGITALGALLLEFTLTMKIISGGTSADLLAKAGFLQTFSMAIAAMTGAIFILSKIDADGIMKALLAIGALSAMMLGILKLGSMISGGGLTGVMSSFKTVLPMLAMLGAIVGALWLLSTIDADQLEASVNALGKVLLSVSAVFGSMSLSTMFGGGGLNALSNLTSFLGIAGIILEIAGVFYLLKDLDADHMVGVSEALSKFINAISIVSIAAAAVSATGGGGMAFLSILGVVGAVTAIEAIAAAVEHFTKGEASKSLDEGLPLLEAIARGIGRFIGVILEEGLLKPLHNTFGDIPDQLLNFINTIGPALKGTENLDASGLDQLKDIMKKIAGIEAEGLIASVLKALSGENSLQMFASDMVTLAKGLNDYCKELNNGPYKKATVKSTTEALTMLTDLANAIPPQGFFSKLLNETDLSQFSTDLVPLAKGLNDFCSTLQTGSFNSEVAEKGAAAAEVLASFAKEVPDNTLIEKVLGLTDFKDFINQLPDLGTKLGQFTTNLTSNGFSMDAATLGTRAGRMLANFASKVPEQSLIDKITGNSDFQDFVDTLPSLGTNLAKFCTKLKEGNFDESMADKGATAGRILAEFAAEIPEYSLIDKLLDTNLETFAKQLPTLAEGLAGFTTTLTDNNFDPGTVRSSKGAISILASLANDIPDVSNGILGWFTEGKLESFGSQLTAFANGIASYATIIGGIANDDIEKSVSAVDMVNSLLEVFNTMNETLGSTVGYGNARNAMDSIYDTYDIAETVSGFFNDLAAAFEGQDEDINSLHETLKNVGANISGWIQEGLYENNQNGESAKSTMTAISKSIAEGLADESALEEIKTSAEAIGDTILDGIIGGPDEEGFIEKSSGAITESIEIIAGVLSDYAADMSSTGSSWGSNLAAGLRSKVAVVRLAAGALASAALNSLRESNATFSSIGSGWASRIGTGLTTSSHTITTSATNLGRVAGTAFSTAYTNAARPTAPVANTDTEETEQTAHKLGMVVADTLVDSIDEGIKEKSSSFTTSVTTMAAYANSVMNEALDTNPVITPVLDMSNVQAGAGLMDSYLGGTFMMADKAAGYTSSLLNGVGTRQGSVDAQNQMNNMATQEALQGIRQDIKDLGESMSHMQMVMNNGALVGQIGRGMDKQLGSIQKFKERWA